jgi:NAD(P)H-flavin reductase
VLFVYLRVPVLILTVRETIAATPRAAIVRLDLQHQPFFYRAGQAAYLTPQGELRRRPYSIASAPEQTADTGLIEFLIQTDTDASSGMPKHAIEPGSQIAIEGPVGSFQFPDKPSEHHFMFIAGGTGIAPLRSMLWHALLTQRNGRIGLIYSVRSPDEFAFLDEFERLRTEQRIAFHHTVTRAASEDWTGRQGRIDRAFLQPLVQPGDTLCFVCGPPALVGEMPLVLAELGVSPKQIVVENWV